MDPEPSGANRPKGKLGQKTRILSFDGGGVRGLISAVIVERLESYLQIKDGEDARIADYFDGIAGTSTGALIACLLVVPHPVTKRPKYSAKDAVNFYLQHSPTVFPRESCGCLGQLVDLQSLITRLRGPLYSSTSLEELLKLTFGDLKLSETVKPVIVPSYDIQWEKSVQFSTKQVESQEIPDCFIRDVCRATSAAPTYFAPYYFSATGDDGKPRDFNMVDGGICANNPAFIGISELQRHDSNRPESEFDRSERLKYENLLVLSLGTGKTDVSYNAETAATWGTLSWIYNKGNVPILDMLMMASEDIVDYNLSNTFYEQGSHDNYLRVQTSELTGDQKKLDNSSKSNLESLIATAKQLLYKQPEKRNKNGQFVPDPRWPTYDAALEQFAQWLVDEKDAQSSLSQPSVKP